MPADRRYQRSIFSSSRRAHASFSQTSADRTAPAISLLFPVQNLCRRLILSKFRLFRLLLPALLAKDPRGQHVLAQGGDAPLEIVAARLSPTRAKSIGRRLRARRRRLLIARETHVSLGNFIFLVVVVVVSVHVDQWLCVCVLLLFYFFTLLPPSARRVCMAKVFGGQSLRIARCLRRRVSSCR